jgi:hypothetical protein
LSKANTGKVSSNKGRRYKLSLEWADNQAISKSGGKWYRITDTATNIIHDVINVTRFCREQKIVLRSMTRVLKEGKTNFKNYVIEYKR